MTLLYSNYNKPSHSNSWYKDLLFTVAFCNDTPSQALLDQLLYSVTGFVKKNLHELHNTVADNVKDGVSLFEGCKIAIIELGLLTTAFVLAPVETVIRAVMAAVLIPFAFMMLCCDKEPLANSLIRFSTISLLHTALVIPETMVSAFYSHPAHYNERIDYVGHGNYYVLCQPPNP